MLYLCAVLILYWLQAQSSYMTLVGQLPIFKDNFLLIAILEYLSRFCVPLNTSITNEPILQATQTDWIISANPPESDESNDITKDHTYSKPWLAYYADTV